MGDPKDQGQVEAQEEQKPKSKLPIILGIFVVLLGIIGFIGMQMFGGSDEESPLPTKILDEPGYVFDFPEPFTVNLAPPDSDRLLTCSISLEIKPRGNNFSEQEALEEMGIDTDSKKTKMSRIKDLILEILKTKNATDTKSIEGMDKIKTEIKTQLNLELQKAEILRVNLTQMVVS